MKSLLFEGKEIKQKPYGLNKHGDRLKEVKKGTTTITQEIKRWNNEEMAIKRNQLDIIEMKWRVNEILKLNRETDQNAEHSWTAKLRTQRSNRT